MRRILIVTVLASTLLTLACAKQMVTATAEQRSREYDAPFDDTWERLVHVVTELGLPVTTIEKDSGLLGTDFYVFDARGNEAKLVLQEQSSLETIQGGWFKMSVLVSRLTDSRTRVKINCQIEKLSSILGESAWRYQPSNGYLEQRYLDLIGDGL